jgi:hypothetical protein
MVFSGPHKRTPIDSFEVRRCHVRHDVTHGAQRYVHNIFCMLGCSALKKNRPDLLSLQRRRACLRSSGASVGIGRVEKPQIIQSRAYYFHMTYVGA